MGAGASFSRSEFEKSIRSLTHSTSESKPEGIISDNDFQVIQTEFSRTLQESKSGENFASSLIGCKDCLVVVEQCDVLQLKNKLIQVFAENESKKKASSDSSKITPERNKVPANNKPSSSSLLKRSVLADIDDVSKSIKPFEKISHNSTTMPTSNPKLLQSGQNIMNSTHSTSNPEKDGVSTRGVRAVNGRRPRAASDCDYSNLGKSTLRQTTTTHLDIDSHVLESLEQANAMFKAEEGANTTVATAQIISGASLRKSRRSSFETGGQRIDRMASISEIDGADNSDLCSVYTHNNDDAIQDRFSCALCHVFFESENQKERHIKYSDSHAKMLAEIEQKKKLLDLKPKGHDEEKEKEQANRWKLIRKASVQTLRGGGALIHTSVQFFWRTREDVEIQVYLHMRTKHLEVIPIDLKTDIEYPRIYFSLPLLDDIVEAKNERRYTVDRESFIKNRETAKRMVLCHYILAHLQMVEANAAMSITQHIIFVPGSMDIVPHGAFVLKDVPPGLIPACPSLRKPISRNPSVDFSAAFEKLKTEKKSFKEALDTAENMSKCVGVHLDS